MRRLVVALLCLALAGCYGAGRKGGGEALAVYDFGPPATRLAEGAGFAGFALEVRASLWFDALGIGYRLAYADPARLRDYTRARWAGPPAQMIQQRLLQKLPLVPHGQAKALCVVRVEIDEFSQIFDSPEASRGVVKGRVIVLDRSRGRIEARDLEIARAAPTPDARGGVAALTEAVNVLAIELVEWERQLRAAGRLGNCGGR